MSKNNYVFWKGSSEITGESILLILTGISSPSQNRKTGPVIQSYILRDGVKPTEYRRQGAQAICGECPIKEACYVGNHYLNFVYDGTERPVDRFPMALLRGRVLRLGAYGDPAAVPYRVWQKIVRWTSGHVGYTHQWETCDRRFQNLCLASVETLGDMYKAWELGWQTYRVGLPEESPTEHEVYCPHYEDPRLKCLQCQLCRGDSASKKQGVFVNVHGKSGIKKSYREIRKNLAKEKEKGEAKALYG
jgi:hypothetical protein